MADQRQDIERAISKLKSLSEAGDGIVEVVACGRSAVPALRALLFEREPSGLLQPRCRAVDALAALKAHDVLIEYLSAEDTTLDPIERLGNDAVVNYAAWALARTREERVFALLLRLSQRPSLSGVIGALGTFGRHEAIPALVNALEEDVSRNVAEFMLWRLGSAARAELLRSARQQRPSQALESESSRRRRRSSLSLLAKIGLGPDGWVHIRPLMEDDDPRIAVGACKLCLLHAPASEHPDAINRLAALLPSADWILHEEIEGVLALAESQAIGPGRKLVY